MSFASGGDGSRIVIVRLRREEHVHGIHAALLQLPRQERDVHADGEEPGAHHQELLQDEADPERNRAEAGQLRKWWCRSRATAARAA